MAPPIITRQQAAATVKAIHDALRKGRRPPGVAGTGPGALATAAVALGLNPSGPAMAMRLHHADRRYKIKVDWSLYRAPKTGPIAGPPSQDAEKLRAVTAQVAILKRQLRDATEKLDAQKTLRREVFRLAEQRTNPPQWLTRPQKRVGVETPILFASDFQWGEVTKKDAMAGINEFNVAIAKRRYRALIEKAGHLLLDLPKSPKYDGFVYLRGGDMISGEIHDELAETNELQAIPAVCDLAEIETWGVRELARRFGKVHVISVPGNHGRVTRKPHSKKHVEHNYDTLSAYMIEREFRGDKRVTFSTPLSGDGLFKVYGWWYLVHHGDRMGSRGGEGFIGPTATIERGHKKLADYFAELQRPIHFILTGHLHTSLKLTRGLSNGCLPGATEYSRDGRYVPKPPAQWLFTSHADRPMAQLWEIELEPRPRVETGGLDLAAMMKAA